ncbi:MAG TPA: TPM domain-containing protein [Candidatus Saccharimonadales bacterium]|nr:TPM domain-containing protein [Candidatus Saccharimonadales bacterium]
MNRRAIGLLAVVALWMAALAGAPGVVAAEASAPPAGPPYPDPVDGQAVYDFGGMFTPSAIEQAEFVIDAIEGQTRAEIVVYTQALGTDDFDEATAEAHAAALMDQWGIGREGVNDGLVILVDLDTSLKHGQARLFGGSGFLERYASIDDLQGLADGTFLPLLAAGQNDAALLSTLGQLVDTTIGAPTDPGDPTSPSAPGGIIAPGPPFPDPAPDRAVYDFAGILTPGAIAEAEAAIDEIEQRTGAEVAVYSQLVDYGVSTEETESRARALIDQWGIGRAGFDDGMVIFFDIDPSLEHGQVQLYAAPGFEATYLTNSDRQAIYENDMVPHLRNADFDGALAVALERVDAAATPENAARLQAGRQVNAVLGLVGAPIIFLGLSGWAYLSWRRFGKDPVYLDDPSILMPAPPPDLTAASGAFVMDGGTSRRALTTAMLDLASRGLLSFREDRGLLGLSDKVGVDVDPPAGDAVEEAQRARNARRPIGPAEQVALRELRQLAQGEDEGYIEADDLPKFGTSVADFDTALERHVVERGWFVDKPSKVVGRWTAKGILAIVAGAVALFIGFSVPISGLVLLGGAAIAGGIVIVGFAQGMPSVTMPGSMIRAMMHAYRRTLQKTMEQSRTMQQVVDGSGLTWLETPDQAVVWGTALGLQHEIEGVLERSLEVAREEPTRASSVWFPTWYHTSSGQSFAGGVAAGSGGSIFSGSAVPDIGSMMSSLGTIGNSPASSGSGGSGGGGFSGGSSGGGGGGAGGGF